MRKTILFYMIVFALLASIFIFFNRAYRELSNYSDLKTRTNTIFNSFQTLANKVKNAAVSNPDLTRSIHSREAALAFYADSADIIHQLELLDDNVKDSTNKRIAESLNIAIREELGWLLKSNVPDSIIHGKAKDHLAKYVKIDSLIQTGVDRTNFLLEDRKNKVEASINSLRLWMILFLAVSVLLLAYNTSQLFKQLKKRQQKEVELDIVLNRINDGVFSLDNNWRYTYLNEAAFSTHPDGKQTIGKLIWDVHPGLEGTPFAEKYREAMRTRKTVEIENYYAPTNTWFSIKIYPSADGLTIFYKDITESKTAEHKLSETIKEVRDYKAALDEAAIVAITDQKGIIRYVNDNFCKISKYPAAELIGQDHRIINSGHHSKEFIRNLWVTIANGKIWKGELKNRAKDGTIYWVDTTIVPFLDEAGKPYQYVAIRADISERKRAEEKITQLNAELEEKVIKRTAELQAANQEMEAFTYSVSHDLRAPLRGIIGFTTILEEDYSSKLDEEAKRITSIIRQNTSKMGQLIDDLLDFSRMGKREMLKTEINTASMVKEVINDLVQQNKINSVTWKIDSLPVVKGDVSMIRQVWINLISNACKYSSRKEKPRVEIESFQQNGQVCFIVKDNGVGFDEAYGHKLFKVFQRLHDEEDFEGTGVGLALVEKIVSRHGGKVWAVGKENEGATFYFSLPV